MVASNSGPIESSSYPRATVLGPSVGTEPNSPYVLHAQPTRKANKMLVLFPRIRGIQWLFLIDSHSGPIEIEL